MSALAHTQSARSPSHLRAHLSAYLLGGGATTALSAGALVVFLSLATFVAFQGLPLGGSSDDAGAAYLGANATAAPTAAAAALGGAHAAVAKNPVPGSRAGGFGGGVSGRSGGGSSGNGASGRSGGGNPSGGSSGSGSSGGLTGSGGGSTTLGGTGVSSPDVPSVPTSPSGSGPTSGAVQGVDNAAGTNLSGPTSGVTGAVDGTATGAVNQVGGAAGDPDLGDQVGGAVSGATNQVLGGGGGTGGGLLGG
jgi:hypothetical protein